MVNFPFRVDQTGTRAETGDTFEISVAPGASLDPADSPYIFRFEAYALSNITNVTGIEIRVAVAVGNQPPAFAQGLPTEDEISEETAKDTVLGTFTAIDPDHTTGISYSLSGDTQDVNEITVFTINSENGELTVAAPLDFQGDEEASGEDAEAEGYVPAEEAGEDNENNIYELRIKASDDETDIYWDFTVTVMDSPNVPASGSRSFIINENMINAGGDEEDEEDEEEAHLLDSDGAKARVLLLDDDGVAIDPADFTYSIDVRNSPEDAVALFDIQSDGTLYLKADAETRL